MLTSQQKSLAVGFFVGALFIAADAFPAGNSFTASQLLLSGPLPTLVSLEGELKPFNLKDATLSKARAGFRVVMEDGQEMDLRCTRRSWDTFCFSDVRGGTPKEGVRYRLLYAQYPNTQEVKDARVLVELQDTSGGVLLSRDQVLETASAGPSILKLGAAAIFGLTGIGLLLLVGRNNPKKTSPR